MPKGVYERGPGKKAKASNPGGFPAKKLDTGGFTRRFSNAGAAQNVGRRSSPNQHKGIWIKHLADLEYGAVGRAPNRAVQYLLCLIPNPEIHEVILKLNSKLPQESYSPVIYLGFSAWLDLFLKMDGLGMKTKECEMILQQMFSDMPNILADRTDLDDMLAIECKAGVSYLERVNKVKDKDKTFNDDMNSADNSTSDGTTPGFTKFIPQEDLEIMKTDGDDGLPVINENMGENMVRLTLHNCLRFPIISEMAIEWLGEEFDHGLWRSQNFSTLAPISTQAWIMIAGLNNAQLLEIDDAARNLIKIGDKEEVEFPFGTALFDKQCHNNTGITLFVKAHMAYPIIKRENNYLHRIWRSFSPYFKCNCTDSSCKDTITWLDQAIWFAFNHLDMVYPRYSPAGRMGAFLNFIQQKLKKPVMAHLVYLQVRDMMIRVTNKLAVDPDCNVQAVLGNTKLVNVCEMMIKDRAFLLKKHNIVVEEHTASIPTQHSSGRHDDFLPPRVSRMSASSSCQVIENIADYSESNVACTNNNDEASVCKGPRPSDTYVTENVKQARLTY